MACGERHTGCILTASTSSGAALVALCTWGRGDGGRLGHGTPCVDVVTPKLVAALPTPAPGDYDGEKTLGAGRTYSFARADTGRVRRGSLR